MLRSQVEGINKLVAVFNPRRVHQGTINCVYPGEFRNYIRLMPSFNETNFNVGGHQRKV